jgi:hypothetical protein
MAHFTDISSFQHIVEFTAPDDINPKKINTYRIENNHHVYQLDETGCSFVHIGYIFVNKNHMKNLQYIYSLILDL